MKKNLYIGGYSILDLADANVYAQALICAKQNKPVLVYDDPLRYYADTIKIDTENDNNVVITKGGKTITITDANSVSSEGEIQSHLYKMNLKISLKSGDDLICDGNIIFYTPTLLEFDSKTSLTSDEIEFLNKYAINVTIFNIEIADGTSFSIYDFKENECDNYSNEGDNTYSYSNLKLIGIQLF